MESRPLATRKAWRATPASCSMYEWLRSRPALTPPDCASHSTVLSMSCCARAVDLGAVAGGQDGGLRAHGRCASPRCHAGHGSVGAIWSIANAKRPRISSGAVVWLMPSAQTAMRRIIKFNPDQALSLDQSTCSRSTAAVRPLDFSIHLLSFVAPALVVALLVALAGPWVLPRSGRPRWWLPGGELHRGRDGPGWRTVVFGRDGKMLTYAAMVRRRGHRAVAQRPRLARLGP